MRAEITDSRVSPLLARWQRQIGGRRIRQSQQLGAMGFIVNGPVRRGLIQIEQLMLVVLDAGKPEEGLRLAGYGAERIEWGVAWGGKAQNRFLKDLALEPQIGARGRQLDLAHDRLLKLGLQLEQELHHALMRRRRLHRRIELPRLWAGLRPGDVHALEGDGPEFEAACRQAQKPPALLLAETAWNHEGQVLLPLNWVSHRWSDVVNIYADVERFPPRHAFRLLDRPRDLVGYRGACQFDFCSTRFDGVGRRELLSCA